MLSHYIGFESALCGLLGNQQIAWNEVESSSDFPLQGDHAGDLFDSSALCKYTYEDCNYLHRDRSTVFRNRRVRLRLPWQLTIKTFYFPFNSRVRTHRQQYIEAVFVDVASGLRVRKYVRRSIGRVVAAVLLGRGTLSAATEVLLQAAHTPH